MVTNTEKIRFLELCFGDVHQFHDGINVAVKCPKCGEPDSPKKFTHLPGHLGQLSINLYAEKLLLDT